MKRRHSWFITMIVLGLLVAASGSAGGGGQNLYRRSANHFDHHGKLGS
jgi:hypothetical protein